MRALLIVIALAAVAHADAGTTIRPPDGWTKGTSKTKGVEVYVSPGGAIELVVSTNTAVLAVGNRADATRAALDDVHGIARRAALTSSTVAEDSWQERADATAKQVEGTLVWRDPDSKVKETARIVVAGDATRLVALTGECIARDDADSALVTACTTALATLDPGIAVADRIAPAIAPAGTPPKPIVEVPDVNRPSRQAPSMSDGSHTPLPPIVIPQESPSTDRRPVFIGAGIVLLAGLFWWNMRRRARLEREDQENDDDR
jgi:hypothetical protein